MDRGSVATADEDLLLALLNTLPVTNGTRCEMLDEEWERNNRPDGASTAAAPADVSPAVAPIDVATLRALRDDLQAVIRGDAPATTLNRRLLALETFPQYDETGNLFWRPASNGTSPLHRSILRGWVSVASMRADRLRPCANDECNLFLLDRSRSGTAKWCSMATCGNRLKARRFTARRPID